MHADLEQGGSGRNEDPAAHTVPTVLSQRGDKLIKVGSVAAVLTVFGASLTLSWSGLTELATHAGFPPHIAWLLPLAIDGAVVGGSIAVVSAHLTGQSKTFPWFMVLAGAVVSIWGNAVAARDADLTAQVVHALAPLSLAGSVHLLTKTVEHRISQAQERIEEERKAREKAEKRLRAMEARKARTSAARATPGGAAGTVEALENIVASQQEGTSLTDIAVAVLEVFPKPPAVELSLALGFTDTPEDVRRTHRALERARRKLKAQQASEPDKETARMQVVS